MDYLLEDIPEGLWKRVAAAAAARGNSLRSFMIDAAFNEVERTDAVLLGRGAADVGAKSVVEPGPDAHDEAAADEDGPQGRERLYLRNLRTVGIATFIKYYELFKGSPNSEAVDALQAWEDYTYNSASTKVSTGKKIIRDPEALRFCLSHAAYKAERISQNLKDRARELLGGLS